MDCNVITSFLDWNDDDPHKSWEAVNSIPEEVQPWEEKSKTHFSKFLSNQEPVGQWVSMCPLPDLFSKQSKGTELHLTDAEMGLFQRKGDLNLTEISEFLTSNFDFIEVGGALAFYEPPCWKILTPQKARSAVYKLIDNNCGKASRFLGAHALDEIIARIMNSPRIQHLEQMPLPDCHALCCQNGIYFWPEDRTRKARSCDLRFSHLEVCVGDIAPDSTPCFDGFLRNVTHGNDDVRQLILEVIGAIVTGYPSKSFFVFEGVSDSGKSQLARFLKDLLGPTACFAVNGINQLADRWTTGMLPGKLLCVCADVPDKPLNAGAVGAIKQMTGDDPIRGELKYQSPFVFQNSAKLLFLTNFPLRIAAGRQDFALERRMVRIPFHYAVPKDEQIPHFHEKLLGEAGGIIWQALQALEALEERNGIFTMIQDNEFEVSSLEPSLSDQERVQNFVRTQCTFDATAKTTVAELYTAFISFDEEAENSIPSSKFGRILSSCGFPIRSCRTTTMRGYEGIRLLG